MTLASVDEDQEPFLITLEDMLANSSDADLDNLSIQSLDNVVGGTAEIVDGGVLFTLDADYNGPASFGFTVDDKRGGTAMASAIFDVTAVNDLPVTVADTATVGENEIASFDLVANDSDLEDDTVTLIGFSVAGVTGFDINPAAAASAFSMVDGELQFNPGTLFDGLDKGEQAMVTIEYVVEDSEGGQANGVFELTVNGEIDNYITGGDDRDMLIGSDNADHIDGAGGDDVIMGRNGQDVIDGGNGNDLIYAGEGDDTIMGGAGRDTIMADGGNDTVFGGDGNDLLFGRDGDDTLWGGAGNDALSGGAGADSFVFKLGDGQDNVLDFEASGDAHDVVELDQDVFADFQALADSGLMQESGMGVQIGYADGSVLTLANVTEDDLTVDHFRFA